MCPYERIFKNDHRKSTLKLRATAVGTLLLCAAFGSGALTLGRVRGAALIGQPLDLSIQLQLDSSEDVSQPCFEADVFHADARQDPSRVKVVLESGSQTGVASLRVTSQSIVDEPMVTVYLRAGCGQKTTRRYVLLADLPSELAQPASNVPTVAAAASGIPFAGPSGAAGSAGSAGSGLSGSSAAAPEGSANPATNARRIVGEPATIASTSARKNRVTMTPPSARSQNRIKTKSTAVAGDPRAATVAVQTPANLPSAPPVGGPSVGAEKSKNSSGTANAQLKLDPIESLSERVASLETSTTPAPSDQTSRDALRVKSLEADVKALLALASKNEASMADMRSRLERAETERFSPAWIYGLLALALASLGGVAVLWRRRGELPSGGVRKDWWQEGRAPLPEPAAVPPSTSLTAVLAAEDSNPAPLQQKPKTAGLVASLLVEPDSQVDVNLVDMDDSMFDKLMPGGADSRKGEVKQAPVEPVSASRQVDSEELMDVRQQAEFFVSLSQTDQAIAVLEKRIAKGNCGPLIYLDLLKIFHSRNLKNDFREVREDFNRQFNGKVPDFAVFHDEGHGIDAYPSVFAHVVSIWPSLKVLEIIETCIFRDPWDDKDQFFDLAAFRDLLFLFAMVNDLAVDGKSSDGEAPPSVTASLEMANSLAKRRNGDPQGKLSQMSRPAPLTPMESATTVAPAAVVGAVIANHPKSPVDLDLSETELGTIYAAPFTAPIPLVASGAASHVTGHTLSGDAAEQARAAESQSLMDFELPSDDELAKYQLKK